MQPKTFVLRLKFMMLCQALFWRFFYHIANIEDTTGRPIWRRPTEAMLGRLDLYPYHEVSILPQIADIGVNEIFAIFMNPQKNTA
jgi:hypothetical protein